MTAYVFCLVNDHNIVIVHILCNLKPHLELCDIGVSDVQSKLY